MLGYPPVSNVPRKLADAFYAFVHPSVIELFGGEWDRQDLEELVKAKGREFSAKFELPFDGELFAADFLNVL